MTKTQAVYEVFKDHVTGFSDKEIMRCAEKFVQIAGGQNVR